MGLGYLDTILAGAACKGAFQLSDGGLLSLSGDDPSVSEDAERTKRLWSSLAAFVPDLGTVIAKRETGVSIACTRGGVILEASAPLNIGMVRAALRNETPIKLQDAGMDAFAAGGTRALWNLASWIEDIETGRALRVSVGDQVHKIWARKGKFGLEGALTPSDLASSILSANASGAQVRLTYDPLTQPAPAADHAPLALFATNESEAAEWHFDTLGVASMRPADASLQSTGRMLALHAHLLTWGKGQPFEVTILRDGGQPEIVAQSNEPTTMRILLDGHP